MLPWPRPGPSITSLSISTQYSADASKEQILLSDARSKKHCVPELARQPNTTAENLLDHQSTEMKPCCFWHMLDVSCSLRQVTSPLDIHSLLLHWGEICLPMAQPPCMDATECTAGTIVRIALQARYKKHVINTQFHNSTKNSKTTLLSLSLPASGCILVSQCCRVELNREIKQL